jgi:hypothetical protein
VRGRDRHRLGAAALQGASNRLINIEDLASHSIEEAEVRSAAKERGC